MPNILRGPCAEACPPEVPPRVGPSVFTLALAPARARHKDGHKKRILAHPHIMFDIIAIEYLQNQKHMFHKLSMQSL